VVGMRKLGPGHQYEIKWHGQAATTWEAASRVRKQIPLLVQAFEQAQQQPQPQQQQQQQQQRQEGATDDAPLLQAVVAAAASGDGADDSSAMREQMAALEQLVRDQAQQMRTQAQQLQQLQASPAHSPQLSPHPSPQLQAASVPQSRFARKEPRAQDLREYEGAPGAKLDEWLQELSLATFLYQLNAVEASSFGVSRLRGAALQWWLALDAAQQGQLQQPHALAAALRARFQPVTAARSAREQLDRLQQGSRPINDYIAEFQRLHTQLPSMAPDDALYAFERGLRRDLAEKLRVQGVTTLQDAIALAARVGGLLQNSAGAAQSSRSAAANQMDVDDGDGASLDERIQRAVLNALSSGAHGSGAGMGAKSQTQRGYQQERSAPGGRGGSRGGRVGGRFGGRGGAGVSFTIPGVPAAIVEQRRAAGQCFRCGSGEHRSMECPNAPTASQPSF
jgi:Retrotransposon gag protein